MTKPLLFERHKHVKFLRRCLDILPDRFSSSEVNRLTIAFFAISGLDLLSALTDIESMRETIIQWIYSLQVLPNSERNNIKRCGFRGSPANGVITHYEPNEILLNNKYDSGHIAMTYTGLATLIILGDNLKRVDKNSILLSLRALQEPNGSFHPLPDDSENDMRFVFCASNISYMLNDWSGMDIEKAIEYIQKSVTYEGGIGQGPGLEAHGGSTYCAIASLVLMKRLHTTFNTKELERLRSWCLLRQETGFQGRPNKTPDTCYSFWVGATLKLLDAYQYVNQQENRDFLLTTQDLVTGGLSKYPDCTPDPMHTYLGIAGLSLMNSDNVISVNPALNLSERAVKHLNDLHTSWTT